MKNTTLASALYNFSIAKPTIPRTASAIINGKEYRYATYDVIMEKIAPLLKRNKLFVTQSVGAETVSTEVIHAVTGEKISSFAPIPPVKNVQELGSVITYLRRYTLSALLNLVVESDIDGVKVDIVNEVTKQEAVLPESIQEARSAGFLQAKAMLASAKDDARAIVVEKIKASVKLTQEEKGELLK